MSPFPLNLFLGPFRMLSTALTESLNASIMFKAVVETTQGGNSDELLENAFGCRGNDGLDGHGLYGKETD